MSGKTTNERVAVLETESNGLKSAIHELTDEVKALSGEMHKFRLKYEKNLSFIGGIAFCIGGLSGLIGAVVLVGVDYVKAKLGIIT